MQKLPYSSSPRESGVTLVELSIVLVIIALLVGGVLAGTSLMKAMELRSLMSEYQKYETAVSTFKQKYNALPGDYNSATTIWGMAPTASSPAGSDSACAVLTKTSPSEGTRTCNGDGSGTIDAGYEEYRAWQQLANATMIDGNFTGVGSTTTAGVGFDPAQNCPKSAFRDGCWRTFYLTSRNADVDVYYLFYGKYDTHVLSHWGGTSAQRRYNPTLFPTEMSELDAKFDDGMPATGKIFTPHGNTGGTQPFDKCTTDVGATTEADATETTAVYRTNTNQRECQFFVKASY